MFLVLSVSTSLTLLGTFKYLGFFVHEAATLLEWAGLHANLPTLKIVLPIGISFYTFQSLGYVIDVYRGKVRASRNVLEYALYVAFFPQLVAGPIERATHLLPQIQRDRHWNTAAFESGIQLMVWGLFKKVVIADNLAPYVNAVYAQPTAYAGTAIIMATVFFALQIYCDFSGYTDIARGTARTLGFELIRNFDQPYVSRTPVEFWRRWHMSLSQWFQDYLYFPLAMHYVRKGGWGSKYKAHIIAMGLIGFWHGANWTFVTFGLYWGVAIALYLYFVEHPLAKRWPQIFDATARQGKALAPVLMFVVACVGWVFFRAQSMGEAWYILTHAFSSVGALTVRRADVASTTILWTLVGGLWCAEWLYRNRPRIVLGVTRAGVSGPLWRHALLVAVLFSYLIAHQGTATPFIYFQF